MARGRPAVHPGLGLHQPGDLRSARSKRIFRGRTWNFVALEAEIPEPRRLQALLCRADAGGRRARHRRLVHVFENRCAHRGAEFCRHSQGNTKEFVCPYHQWSYDLKGNLQGVPFKRGVNEGRRHAQGLPQRGPRPAQARTSPRGTAWSSPRIASDVEPLEEYLTPEILKDFDVVFNGSKLKILGYYRNELPCNWKMYHENLKDPYHATLLHSFLVVFGLLVAGNKSAMIADPCTAATAPWPRPRPRTSTPARRATRTRRRCAPSTTTCKLRDDRFLEFVKEFDSPWSVTMQTIWPNLIVQREMNTLGVRQIVPNGPNSMIMLWTMFGYEDDTEEMTQPPPAPGQPDGPVRLPRPRGQRGDEVRAGRRAPLAAPTQDVLKLDGDQRRHAPTSLISEAAIRGDVQLLPRSDGVLTMNHRLLPIPRAASMPRATRELRLEIEEFNADYCATLDAGEVEAWPDYFTEDARLPRHRARERRARPAGRPGLRRGPRR